MLFNSYFYIFVFLPIVAVGYFTFNRFRLILIGKVWLVLASLFFYSYWNLIYLPLIVCSMLVNFVVGTALTKTGRRYRKPSKMISSEAILATGIVFNLGLLGYYKYADFFLTNLNATTNTQFSLLHLTLPLAISFFTFQQIAYLVDSYKSETQEYDFLNYCLFVSFFPQLIAGPIVHHKEMMPQFARAGNKIVNPRNIAIGITIFFIGLFKKVIIADTFAVWATAGFDQANVLMFLEAWTTSLSYTFQIYYDFSGYTDMAIGSAYILNIKLPLNFNSPYKASNIRDFWRRWHMTLSRWLKNYVYIPLGGNRNGQVSTYLNLFATFLIGGLWHGAAWTFVLWGAMHGFGVAIHRFWQGLGFRMPKFFGWLLTFLFVNCSWVFFRANSFEDAVKVFKGMFGMNGIIIPARFSAYLGVLRDYGVTFDWWVQNVDGTYQTIATIVVFGMISFVTKNSMELKKVFQPNWKWAVFVPLTALIGIINLTKVSEFLYFQF